MISSTYASSDVIAVIESGNPLPKAMRPYLATLVQRDVAAQINLSRANLDRTSKIHCAVHRAADQVLTEPVRRSHAPEAWPRLVQNWLTKYHAVVDLERCPCWRTVRDALVGWEPATRPRRIVSPLGGWD